MIFLFQKVAVVVKKWLSFDIIKNFLKSYFQLYYIINLIQSNYLEKHL